MEILSPSALQLTSSSHAFVSGTFHTYGSEVGGACLGVWLFGNGLPSSLSVNICPSLSSNSSASKDAYVT